MFFMEEMEKRDYAVKAATKLHQSVCSYIGPDGRGTGRCDCKYGVALEPKARSGEVSGCPEGRMIAMIIASIPKREWARLVKKACAGRRRSDAVFVRKMEAEHRKKQRAAKKKSSGCTQCDEGDPGSNPIRSID